MSKIKIGDREYDDIDSATLDWMLGLGWSHHVGLFPDDIDNTYFTYGKSGTKVMFSTARNYLEAREFAGPAPF